MKVSVYGAGNQNLYINKIKAPELFGGEPPYGGSRVAMEFAQAGHDVILSEPDRNALTDEMWKKVEESGVKVTNDDIEAAKHGEVHIFFTPRDRILEIIKNILPHLPKDAIILTTYNICPLVPYHYLKYKFKERSDVGISSVHPTAIPGTPQHTYYIIGGTSLEGKDYITEEQLKKCIQLAESVNKKTYIVPIGAICPTGNMGSSLVTAVALAGILDYYTIGRKVMDIPEEVIELDILMALQTLASLVETSGISGLLKALDVELIRKSTSFICLTEDQKTSKAALERLKNIDEELMERVKNAKVNPTTPVAPQRLVNELRVIMGDRAADGAIKRSMRKLFMNE
ncbi:H(2)-dependent methylenetetrahydromethanopterin dehydrogenase-related protein [Methanothermococcus sp. SCGC AD-155-C09]|nr:H(2)-dependent methylenetetrahydromethanopterin dehydrogenase-related protein [Methanothermococcus sp. SCGC AD-155-C09]